MKISRKLSKTQRKSLDEKLKAFALGRNIIRPKSGWIKAIRESIGMTTAQLAKRMGIQQSGVTLLEQREVLKTVSLDTLERAAESMNCRLIYAIVPDDSLEKIVDNQAHLAAQEILKNTLNTMELESQIVGQNETSLHLEELSLEIKNKLDRRLWGTK